MKYTSRSLCAATLCAVAAAAPFSALAQAAPACEQAYGADMNQLVDDVSYAYKWMEDTFSTTWQSYGFNCNYNSAARQACTTAAERLSSAAYAGQRIVQQASASGCFSCTTDYLWRVAYELDDFANKLAAQHFASDGSVMLTEMLHNRVNGVFECSANGNSTTAQPPLPGLPPANNGQSGPATLAPPPGGACTSVDSYAGARLNSGFGWVLDNKTLPDCVTTCENEPTCTGYDYNTATAQCVIRSETMAQDGLETIAGWTHFECN